MKKKLLTKKLSERLKTYGVSAGAIVAGAAGADAQVVYTDVNPNDSTVANGDSILLDLNNDGTDDFSFHTGLFTTVIGGTTYFMATHEAKALGPNEIAASTAVAGTGTTATTYFYPYALGQNSAVDAGLDFEANGGDAQRMALGIFTYPGGVPTTLQLGEWTGTPKDRYVGLKLDIAGSTHYGWARFDADPNRLILKDYAYEATAGVAINTSSRAHNIVATDIGNNYDGSDLQVEFEKAGDESAVTEYRVFIVKSSQTSFDMNDALAVPAADYIAISPTGSDITHTFSATDTDVDGDIIVPGVVYRAYVITVGPPVGGFNPAQSSLFMLSFQAETAQNVSLTDISDFGDGRDLMVEADTGANQTGIDEYRIMVVKEADAATFTLADAQAVATGNYTSLAPSNSNIVETLTTGTNDVDGDPITINQPYQVFILSMTSLTPFADDNLSGPSNSVTLTQPAVEPAMNIVLEDTNDFGDGRDLMISFDPAANENTVNQYRIMIVKAEQASNFSLAMALTIAQTNYTAANPTGSTQHITLTSASKLATGGSIEDSVAYVAFILSKASAQSNGQDTLAGPSNELTLITEPNDSVNSVTEINALANSFYFTNPANGKLQVVRRSPANTATDLALYDVQGRLIENRRMKSQTEMFALSSGTYVVRVKEGDVSTSFSVVVQ